MAAGNIKYKVTPQISGHFGPIVVALWATLVLLQWPFGPLWFYWIVWFYFPPPKPSSLTWLRGLRDPQDVIYIKTAAIIQSALVLDFMAGFWQKFSKISKKSKFKMQILKKIYFTNVVWIQKMISRSRSFDRAPFWSI